MTWLLSRKSTLRTASFSRFSYNQGQLKFINLSEFFLNFTVLGYTQMTPTFLSPTLSFLLSKNQTHITNYQQMTSMSSGTSTCTKIRLSIFFHIPLLSWVSKFSLVTQVSTVHKWASTSLPHITYSIIQPLSCPFPTFSTLNPLWHRSFQIFIIPP